ncbi:unnamed protein product [Sphagnum compactum]
MASQWHACVASSSFSPPCFSSSSHSSLFAFHPKGFSPSLGRLATSCKTQNLIPRSSSITSSSTPKMQNGGGKIHSALISTWSRVPGPIRGYPWGQASVNFAWRLADLLWVTGKWLAIPVLLVSALSEVSYTLMQEKIFLIPAGMLGGFAFAGMVKETALEMCEALESVQVTEVPWHIIVVGFFFLLVKAMGPHFPAWGRVVLPHFANGGLWQTMRLLNQWRRHEARKTKVELDQHKLDSSM